MAELVNRVAKSPLITIDLEKFYPSVEMFSLDIRPWLFKDLILKEKDFRKEVKEHNWKQYQGKILLITCSSDAIIPAWAYMLVTASAAEFAEDIFKGGKNEYLVIWYRRMLKQIDLSEIKNRPVVLKGCSNIEIPAEVYVEATRYLKPSVRSIMYGEPCSTVPIWKKPHKMKRI